MSTLLYAGTVLGAVCGILHAITMYRNRIRDGAADASALWYAAWTFGLWTLFGGYLLIVWLIGGAGMMIARAVRAGS